MADLSPSDVEREKLRQQLLTLMDFGGLDFNRPLIMLSRDALLTGKMAFPPKIPPAMLAKAEWPHRRGLAAQTISIRCRS